MNPTDPNAPVMGGTSTPTQPTDTPTVPAAETPTPVVETPEPVVGTEVPEEKPAGEPPVGTGTGTPPIPPTPAM